MLYEYKDIFVALYAWLFWPLVIGGFFVSKDANTRWFILGFAVITALSIGSGKVIKMMEWPGWLFHLSKIGFAYLIMRFVLYRPLLSVKIGAKLQKLPLAFVRLFMAVYLPAKYCCRLVPAELAMRKLYAGIIAVQATVLLAYALAYTGIAAKGGWFEMHGINRHVVWDAAYSAYLIFLVLELLLLLAVIVSGFRARFKA